MMLPRLQVNDRPKSNMNTPAASETTSKAIVCAGVWLRSSQPRRPPGWARSIGARARRWGITNSVCSMRSRLSRRCSLDTEILKCSR